MYAEVLMKQFGETVIPPRTGKPGRPARHDKRWPKGAVYATVNKTYRKGRVAAVTGTIVHGTPEDLAQALAASTASATVNTSFVERHNGTDRSFNARKRCKTYEFSKDLVVHMAVSWWVLFCYNFHHIHRSLGIRQPDGKLKHQTPAMAASLTTAPLTMHGILSTQLVGFADLANLHRLTSAVQAAQPKEVLPRSQDTTRPPKSLGQATSPPNTTSTSSPNHDSTQSSAEPSSHASIANSPPASSAMIGWCQVSGR